MVQIKATDALGTGLVIYADEFGMATPLFMSPLETYENLVTDWEDDTTLYRFLMTGDPVIVAASAVTLETDSSITFQEVTYENASAEPVIVVKDIGITLSDENIPPWIPLDLTDAALNFVATGQFSLQGDDQIIGNSYTDYIRGLQGDDRLSGRGGDDYLYGDEGDDLILGGAGADYIDGGDGTDTASYTTSTTGITINLADNSLNTGDAVGDVLVNIENIAGTPYADSLSGTIEANTFFGGEGDDTISGKGGDDRIKGGAGDDMIFGDMGDDWLVGGDGNDTIDGGGGYDKIYGQAGDDMIFADQHDTRIDGGDGYDTADFSAATAGVYFSSSSYSNSAEMVGIEAIVGTDFRDSFYLWGEDGDLVIDGGGSNDTIYGGEGNDTIDGGDGNDYLSGNGGDDILYGGEGDDSLDDYEGDDIFYGGNGNDYLYYYGYQSSAEMYGENGDDRLYLWGGTATASGGIGNDYFSVEAYTLSETITAGGDEGDDSFNIWSGKSVLTGGDGNDSFKFYYGWDDGETTITDWDNEALMFDRAYLADWDYLDSVGWEEYYDYWDTFDPAAEDILDHAEVVGGDTVLTFDLDYYTGVVTIEGVTDPTVLADYISLFSYYY